MGWLERTARIVGSVAREVIRQKDRQPQAKRLPSAEPVGRRRQKSVTPSTVKPSTVKDGAAKKGSTYDSVFTTYAQASEVVEYHGPLPALQYVPKNDGNADPGEVVWAWVPYEDDPTQGKDRPVLILAGVPGGYVAVQLTSRDHAHTDSYTTDQYGRIWLDIGSGGWDSQGRDSEARLDRLLYAPKAAIRREGSALPQDKYLAVAEALHALYVKS